MFDLIALCNTHDELSACSAFHREGRHQADGLDLGASAFGSSAALDLGGVEVYEGLLVGRLRNRL